MNFREHFEAWHKAKYGFVGNYTGSSMSIEYRTSTVQARWEAWQACADWHTAQQKDYQDACESVGREDHGVDK